MEKRTLKRTLYLVLSLILSVGIVLTSLSSVFASEDTDKDAKKDPSNGNLVKQVVAPNNATFSETFNFTATPQGGDGTTVAETPALTIPSITVAANKGVVTAPVTKTDAGAGTATYSDKVVLIGNGGIIGTAIGDVTTMFPHAGEYVYLIKETKGSKTDWTYDESTYRLKVYVTNGTGTNAGKLILQGITVAKGGSATEAGEKVDPTKPDDGKIDLKGLEGFTFLNKYAPSAKLTISNDITGDYADLTKKFDFTDITVQLPKSYTGDGTDLVIKKVDAKGNETTITATVDTDGKLTIPDQKLGKDDKIVFENLPVGSDYSYKVAGEDGYTPTALNTNGVGDDENVNGSVGDSLTVPNSNITKITQGDNTSKVTETYKKVTPTGVIVKVLPFVLVIGLAVVGIALNFRNKRKYNA